MSSFVNHPNVKAVSGEEELDLGEVSNTDKAIREKILHILTIYPRISPSMLQVGVGTALPPAIWKPVMMRMEEEGIIKRESVQCNTPAARVQIYTVLSLGQTS